MTASLARRYRGVNHTTIALRRYDSSCRQSDLLPAVPNRQLIKCPLWGPQTSQSWVLSAADQRHSVSASYLCATASSVVGPISWTRKTPDSRQEILSVAFPICRRTTSCSVPTFFVTIYTACSPISLRNIEGANTLIYCEASSLAKQPEQQYHTK